MTIQYKNQGFSLTTSNLTTVLTIDSSSRALIKDMPVTNEHSANIIVEAYVPDPSDYRIKAAMNELNCSRAIALEITPKPLTKVNECHYNVLKHVKQYGGSQIKGYYLAVDKYTKRWAAFGHSVWKREDALLDITPVEDKRTMNIFIWDDKQETEVESYIIGGIKQDVSSDSLKGFSL